MIIRLVMLAEFVAITAALAMPESLQSLGLASFILATAALVVALFPSSAFLGLAKRLRPGLVVVLAAPALWMALQAVPMPMHTLGNPIWATASAALSEHLAEIITVDIGATMRSLAQYCAVLAAALVTAVITLDRYRAAQVLHILLSIAMIATAMWFGKETAGVAGPDGSTVAVLGVLLSCATAIRAADQIARHSRPGTIAPAPLLALSAATIAMIVCLAALLIRTNSTAVVAALLGSGILLSVFAIRRWFLGLWGTAGVFATAAIFFIASATVIPFRTNTDVTIALSTSSQIATERMLQDVRPAGSGAGASTVLLPLYRDIGIGAPRERPTAAAAMVIDMGWAFLCGLVVLAMLGACILIRRSLSRAYDYVYPALGAGASIALTILAFADHGILGLGASLLVAALFGLAFGQSVSGAGREAISWESKEASDWMAGPTPASRPRLAPAFVTLWPRVALTVLGIALIIQTIWIVLTGWWYLGGQSSLSAAVSAAAAWPNEISKPVSAAATHEEFWIRGESRSRGDPALAADEQKTELPAASNAFARALRSSPLRGDIWLMLAAASKQNSIQTAATLKMSYYTAPNDLDLLPLRLSVALATDAVVRELEFRDLIKRDVSLVVTRRPAIRPALVAAYRSASAEGKIYLENLISELDPTYLDNMRARNSRQGSR
ncbi:MULTISPECIES: hypothetical protein [unclassified Bradyrhizobium]|uniref:hypothetical protein n=1 Tax=unclassified Bradyrhizobium TaxID=2631580 RepID=UPI001FF89952|nr:MULTISPECIES: hypothetical protein [unclassified Bradyrhizobium]MCK1712892.1 hypothetical protein [Bradyrhizobium sp. 143]MCK1730766.1 hypothetical protein [Bradyrhizobium sp. 142]